MQKRRKNADVKVIRIKPEQLTQITGGGQVTCASECRAAAACCAAECATECASSER